MLQIAFIAASGAIGKSQSRRAINVERSVLLKVRMEREQKSFDMSILERHMTSGTNATRC